MGIKDVMFTKTLKKNKKKNNNNTQHLRMFNIYLSRKTKRVELCAETMTQTSILMHN